MGTPKRKEKQTPEAQFHSSLTFCSKNKDLSTAISLYESAVSRNTRLNQHHFNTLLYLCSNSVIDPALKQLALEYGFRMFDHMLSTEVVPNEATITAVARLAAAKGDGDYAFKLVKGMEKYNVLPRLRTCDPALFCFCEKLEADKAYEVEEHMNKVGVTVEEPEIAALLKVSAETGRGERVYDYLHKLRNTVRCVSESTAKIIEDWYRDGRASEVGEASWDSGRVKEVVLRNGGGWHGQGWIGKGDWDVQRANVDSESKCCSCGEHLVCVDIDCAETDRAISTMLGLLPSDQFSVTVRVSRAPLDRLLASSIITGYTLWNAEYRISLMRNFDISMEDSVDLDGSKIDGSSEVVDGEEKDSENGFGGSNQYLDSSIPHVFGDLSPEALNYIQRLQSELSNVKEELKAQKQENTQLEYDTGHRNDLLDYLRSLDSDMVTELSRPSSLEVKEIIHQLVQNILQRFFRDGESSEFEEDLVKANIENVLDSDGELCDTVRTSRDYLAKLLFWCMLLGHHLRGLENRLHLSCVVGLL